MSLESSFADQRIWAVVGVSADREKYGNIIYRRLKEANYTVYPIHPKLTEVEGDPCFPSLSVLPQLPEVVNVVVPPAAGPGVVAECLKLGIKRIWFQPGSESEEAITQAKEGGMEVLSNACILLTHKTWE